LLVGFGCHVCHLIHIISIGLIYLYLTVSDNAARRQQNA
jgi:hypothetical protein